MKKPINHVTDFCGIITMFCLKVIVGAIVASMFAVWAFGPIMIAIAVDKWWIGLFTIITFASLIHFIKEG